MGEHEPYNYSSFPVAQDVEDFQRFPEIVKAGSRAPDTTLTDLDSGECIQLSDITRRGITVLEFGSLTWPYCALACPALDRMVREYTDRGLQSVFIYTREAHPGENYPAHETFEQKMQYARDFREKFNVTRPILVDDLEGTTHRAFGTMPNMTYILNQAHTVLFRANWTDPVTIQFALDYHFGVQDRRKSGLRLNPFYAELHGFRWVDDEAFFEGLELAGQQAIDDFHRAREMWARGEHLGTLKNKTLS